MKITKLIIFSFLSLFFTFPSFSLTWKEIFESLKNESYNFPENATNKRVTCWKKVYWEEYVEGNKIDPGYVNSFKKEIKIDCPN